MSRPLVIFHGGCSDGFAAAWAANLFFKGEADFHAANHSDPIPPGCENRDLFILDFSYKRAPMLQLISVARSVTLIDHHDKVDEELAGLETTVTARQAKPPKFIIDKSHSGGRLTWDYFFPDRKRPWLVDYTEDRDTWAWKLPNSRELSAFIASHPFDFATWDRWAGIGGDAVKDHLCGAFTGREHATAFFSDAVSQGAAILRYQQQIVDAAVKNAREITLAGHKVLCTNTTALTSEIAGALAAGRAFGVTFWTKLDGSFVYSLRVRDGDVNVADIARSFGGGGHPRAAGFNCVHCPEALS